MSKDIANVVTSIPRETDAVAAADSTELPWPRMIVAALVLATGIALSVFGSKQLVDFARERERHALEEDAAGKAEQAQLAIDRALQSLGSVRAFYDASGGFSADEFSRFVKSDAAFHHGTLALGWVPRITHEERAAFEHGLRPIGGHTARIFEANGHGLLVASPPQADYFPVQFLVSLVDGELVQGMNLAALSWLRRPLEESIGSGQTVTVLRNRTEQGISPAFVLQAFMPVYDPRAQSRSGAGAPRSALAGFAMGLFDVDQLFRSVFDAQHEPYDVAVFALTRQGDERQVFALRSGGALDQGADVNTIWTREFQVGDQRWRALFSARRAGGPGWLSYVGLAIGLLLTTLLSMYLFLAQWRTAQVLHLSRRLQQIQQSLFEQRVSTAVQTQLREQAQASEIAKTHLFLAASHDLRQPMQALGLYLGHAMAEDSGRSRWLIAMQQSFDSMRDMFDTLLDWSRLEFGRLQPQIRDFDVREVLDRLAQEYGEQARAKGVHFLFASSAVGVRSDPVLLERVLRNLLTNAVRYTARGTIRLCCDGRGETVRLRVADTGVGMPPADRTRLFEAFERGDQPVGKHEGLGLGLAIARQTLALLGHSLRLSSSMRRGSVFSILLPTATVPLVSPPKAGLTALTGCRILVVDDDQATLTETAALLRRWGATVSEAGNFSSAAQVLDSDAPDCIITDQFLPDGTGINLLEIVESRQCDCACMLVSGDVEFIERMHVERPALIALRKPVSPLRMRSALMQCLRNEPASVLPRTESA